MYIANLIPYKCMKQLCNNICNDISMQNKQYKNNMHMQARKDCVYKINDTQWVNTSIEGTRQ